MKEQLVHIEGVGEVKLRESQRARRLNIMIKPFNGVVVTVPMGTSFKKAEELVRGRVGWIRKHLPRIKAAENKLTIFHEDSEYHTRHHQLILKKYEGDRIRVLVNNGRITIKYPEHRRVAEKEVQDHIRTGIERAWRKEAGEYLPGRLKTLADEHGLSYNGVTIRNTRTRWGSCTRKNRINLSLHLMRLPDHLIDYVLLHELAHTRVKKP